RSTPLGELLDRVRERLRVGQERRDILEADAFLWPVRDLANLLGEIHPIMLTQAGAGRARKGAETAPGPARPGPRDPRPRPLVTGQSRRAALAIPRRRGRELLPNDPEGKELVTLKTEDRLEPFDVLLAEQSVSALRAARREQTLVFQIADLRDGDVRKLVLER